MRSSGRPTVVRLLGGVLWTTALVGGLWGLDRLGRGPPVAEGGSTVADPDDLAAATRPLAPPGYLNEAFRWPPLAVHQHLSVDHSETRDATPSAGDGWWLALAVRGGAAPTLWIGNLSAPPPEMSASAASCLSESRKNRCQRPWRALSAHNNTAGTIHVITTLRAAEAGRVLRGMARAGPRR